MERSHKKLYVPLRTEEFGKSERWGMRGKPKHRGPSLTQRKREEMPGEDAGDARQEFKKKREGEVYRSGELVRRGEKEKEKERLEQVRSGKRGVGKGSKPEETGLTRTARTDFSTL